MARIGEHEVSYCMGSLQRGQPRVRTWIKPGHPGRGSHHGPIDADIQTLRTLTLVESASVAQQTWDDYQETARNGALVDVVDGLDQSFGEVRVCGCVPALQRRSGPQPWGPIGGHAGSMTHLVMVDWLLLLSEEL